MTEKHHLRLDDKVAAEDLLYADMFHTGDRKILLGAVGIAILIHIVVLIINFPEIKHAVQEKKSEKFIVVKKYVPPPPKIERRQIVKKEITKKVPLPDPTPDEPEPIREPEPDIEPEPLPLDAEILIGDPEPPPPSGPLTAGVGNVTNPVRIEASYVQPEYPEIARRARLHGNVILQAIVLKDGTVDEAQVLRCTRPNVGFEEAAIKAVKQWRYQPATQNGKPVDVYFTVVVEFELQ